MKVLLSVLALAVAPALAIESGDACSAATKLPRGVTCFDRTVYDCRNSDDGGGGRMGYVACGQLRNKKLRVEMQRRLTAFLARVKKIPEEEIDHGWVQSSLRKSQEAWKKAANAECDLQDSLLGKGGNASAGVMVDCEAQQLRLRIEVLKKLEKK